MTLSFGGGAGVLTIPGLTADGNTPPGIVVDGAVTAGDFSAVVNTTDSQFAGVLEVFETVGNIVDGKPPLSVHQGAALPSDSGIAAVAISRFGALGGHQYTSPALTVQDASGSTAAVAEFIGTGGATAIIGAACGLGLFGHAAPTVPRTLAQATITAITDANAKAAVQAVANALSDMGVLTLT